MDAMVVAGYAEVTEHIDLAIARVNARFGTAFHLFEPTPGRTRRCFDLIEMRSRKPPWAPAIQDFLSGLVTHAELERRAAADPAAADAALPEHRTPRPSAYKEGRKDALRAAYAAPAHAHLRRRAEALYSTFAGESGRARLVDPHI
jgi:hypothetical protein